MLTDRLDIPVPDMCVEGCTDANTGDGDGMGSGIEGEDGSGIQMNEL